MDCCAMDEGYVSDAESADYGRSFFRYTVVVVCGGCDRSSSSSVYSFAEDV